MPFEFCSLFLNHLRYTLCINYGAIKVMRLTPFPGIVAMQTRLFLWLLPALLCGKVDAQVSAQSWLLSALRFIEWPDAARQQAINVCYPANPAITTALQGQSVRNVRLVVMPLTSAQQTGPCDAFIVVDSNAIRDGNWMSTIAGRPVLSIGLTPDFCALGGMVCRASNLHTSHLYAVNRTPLNRSGFRVSSHLPFYEASVVIGAGKLP